MGREDAEAGTEAEDNSTESTTELIAALCEISLDTADVPPSGSQIDAIERRLKTEDPRK
jgi:hypothetical protein